MDKKAQKYIKVVDLKRFMPETHSKRRTIHTSMVSNKANIHSSKKKSNINLEEVSESHDARWLVDRTVEGTEGETHDTDTSKLHKQSDNGKKHIDTAKSKVKFRNCSHTPEELSKLTEHCDETLVKVGDTFDSRELFRQYLNDNAKSWFYYYVCRNSKKKIVEYNCICMAYNLKPREVVIRKQKKRTTACPCKIRLTCDQSTDKVVVYYVCNHHDHAVTEAAFHQYPHAKYLPQHVKDEFLDLAYLGLDVELIQKYIHSLVGLTIKRKDIWSYAYKFKRNIFQRSLTEDRKIYMEDLILSIRATYKEPYDRAINEKSVGEGEIVKDGHERGQAQQTTIQEVFKKIREQRSDTISKEDDINITNNKSEDSLLEDVLGTDIDMANADVIVQYINERGILCDENGTPVTNSSAIMQFINNYEYIIPETNVKEEQYPVEGTVFSELVESIDEEIYPIDWDSIHEINPLFEKTSVISKTVTESYFENAKDLVSNDEIAQELLVKTTEGEHRSNHDKTGTILNNILVNFDKSPPTLQSPGLYADVENFKKYYFVDHRYIKYEEDSNKDQSKLNVDRRGDTYTISLICGEYIKAPDVQFCSAPIRHCRGHEDLTLLTDPDAILSGAKFLMHHVFLTYINERANRWFFYYSLVESGKSPEYYVYKCVYAKHRVSRNAYRAKGLRKRSNLTTQCPCQIRLRRLDSDPAYLTVLYSCNHHDHALDSRLFTEQPHSRRLPDHIKEEVKDLLSLGVSFDVLRKYVTAETGLRVYVKYFHNVKVKMRKTNENRQFTEERLMVLSKKIKDLEAIYGNSSKRKRQTRKAKKRKHEPSQIVMEDRFTQVGLDETATQTIEYLEMEKIDDVAEEVCIVQEDTFTPHVMSKRSRLETRLQNLSSHEDTLLKVKKLQESVRCDVLRHPCS